MVLKDLNNSTDKYRLYKDKKTFEMNHVFCSIFQKTDVNGNTNGIDKGQYFIPRLKNNPDTYEENSSATTYENCHKTCAEDSGCKKTIITIQI